MCRHSTMTSKNVGGAWPQSFEHRFEGLKSNQTEAFPFSAFQVSLTEETAVGGGVARIKGTMTKATEAEWDTV